MAPDVRRQFVDRSVSVLRIEGHRFRDNRVQIAVKRILEPFERGAALARGRRRGWL
jgi:hypothetical protein